MSPTETEISSFAPTSMPWVGRRGGAPGATAEAAPDHHLPPVTARERAHRGLHVRRLDPQPQDGAVGGRGSARGRRERAAPSGERDVLRTVASSTSPCRWRSSGTSATPAAIAAPGDPDGTDVPPTGTGPARARRAPAIVSSRLGAAAADEARGADDDAASHRGTRPARRRRRRRGRRPRAPARLAPTAALVGDPPVPPHHQSASVCRRPGRGRAAHEPAVVEQDRPVGELADPVADGDQDRRGSASRRLRTRSNSRATTSSPNRPSPRRG